jgi:protease-4
VVGDHGTGDLTGDPAFCLEISVAGEMAETGKDGNALIGVPSVIGFARQISAIRKAALDPRVRAAIVHLRAHSLGWARSEEMMQALLELRARKIPLIACVESADLRSLMIASAADEIHVHESAQVRTSGPAMLATFYTGLLEKLGLEARLLYRSEYKTAAQSVTEKSMTVAHRESAQRVVDLITSRALALIATNRGVPLTRVLGWSRDGLMTPREAVKKGLVTGTLSWDGVRRFIAGKGFRLARPEAWLGVQSGFSRPSGIAIVHVEGTIVNGGGGLPQLPFGETSAGADTVVRALSRATSDRSIRGIIVRVQSGGGDVLASERMRAAIVAAAQRKPLVISMADLAASGGYYLACGDGKTPIMVFAKSATLTGSIGVITGKLVTRKLRGTLGLASESVGDSNARIYGDETDFTPNQLALVTKMLDYWYDEFKSAVARGRRMQRERVEQYARGRVWAGMDAIEFGLIDREGGFHAALLWLADRINKPWQDLDLIEINSQPANLSRLVTGGISLDLSAIMDNDAWPGLFFSGRALALLPWKLQLE